MSSRLALPLFLVPLAIAGCSRTHIPSPADLPIVYKIDVQQGNVVTQDMLAQLKPGMDRGKVKFIMGTPLIADTFHNDRWDYIFTMQERGGERTQRRVSLYFKDDKLERVAGDVKPAAGAIATSDENASKTVDVPEPEKSLVERMKDKVSGDKKTATATESAAATDATKPEASTAADGAKAESTTETTTANTNTPATEVQESKAQTHSTAKQTEAGSDFVIDNTAESTGTGQSTSNASGEAATPVPAPDATEASDTASSASAPKQANGDIMPRFQSESDLDSEENVAPAPTATEADTRGDAGNTAAEAASGSDKSSSAAAGGTGKSTTVSIPEDAPQPKKKGFFRRLLEKVGVGDNEDGEYQSADPKYKDVSNPETQSH
ncbi:MAG: outer membrane protein assembly factor BamE [Gammaproteobacteria bacterium]